MTVGWRLRIGDPVMKYAEAFEVASFTIQTRERQGAAYRPGAARDAALAAAGYAKAEAIRRMSDVLEGCESKYWDGVPCLSV